MLTVPADGVVSKVSVPLTVVIRIRSSAADVALSPALNAIVVVDDLTNDD
jgi:hypothetical protein